MLGRTPYLRRGRLRPIGYGWRMRRVGFDCFTRSWTRGTLWSTWRGRFGASVCGGIPHPQERLRDGATGRSRTSLPGECGEVGLGRKRPASSPRCRIDVETDVPPTNERSRRDSSYSAQASGTPRAFRAGRLELVITAESARTSPIRSLSEHLSVLTRSRQAVVGGLGTRRRRGRPCTDAMGIVTAAAPHDGRNGAAARSRTFAAARDR